MKIIENKYEDPVFPKRDECYYCGSILEVERDDCHCIYNKYTSLYEYYYICPCCKQECKFENPL